MSQYERRLLEHLQAFLTPQRRRRFDDVLNWRTRWITVVLADLYQPHNTSAVLRSCDAFGVQDVHVIESDNSFEPNPQIALGADQWLTLHQYRGGSAFVDCVTTLQRGGYLIAATVPGNDSRPLDDLPMSAPVALLFGTEKEGLPPAVVAGADVCVHLPMFGFVESFNVSVAAALSLQTLTRKLHASESDWRLSCVERDRLLLDWSRATVPGAEAIERRFEMEWQSG